MKRVLRVTIVVAATLFAVWVDLAATSLVASPDEPLTAIGVFALQRATRDVRTPKRAEPVEAAWTPDESRAGVRPDFAH